MCACASPGPIRCYPDGIRSSQFREGPDRKIRALSVSGLPETFFDNSDNYRGAGPSGSGAVRTAESVETRAGRDVTPMPGCVRRPAHARGTTCLAGTSGHCVPAPLAQPAEAAVSETVQSWFESREGHQMARALKPAEAAGRRPVRCCFIPFRGHHETRASGLGS